MADLESEIASRRTFAIIAHPDAGKTTLTEKLCYSGGLFSWRVLSKHAVSNAVRIRTG